MIDAEMYGITLSANTDKRCSAPPENMLNMSSRPPPCCFSRRAIASGFTPGTGMNDAEAEHDQRTDHEQQALLAARSTCRAKPSMLDCDAAT